MGERDKNRINRRERRERAAGLGYGSSSIQDDHHSVLMPNYPSNTPRLVRRKCADRSRRPWAIRVESRDNTGVHASTWLIRVPTGPLESSTTTAGGQEATLARLLTRARLDRRLLILHCSRRRRPCVVVVALLARVRHEFPIRGVSSGQPQKRGRIGRESPVCSPSDKDREQGQAEETAQDVDWVDVSFWMTRRRFPSRRCRLGYGALRTTLGFEIGIQGGER